MEDQTPNFLLYTTNNRIFFDPFFLLLLFLFGFFWGFFLGFFFGS